MTLLSEFDENSLCVPFPSSYSDLAVVSLIFFAAVESVLMLPYIYFCYEDTAKKSFQLAGWTYLQGHCANLNMYAEMASAHRLFWGCTAFKGSCMTFRAAQDPSHCNRRVHRHTHLILGVTNHPPKPHNLLDALLCPLPLLLLRHFSNGQTQQHAGQVPYQVPHAGNMLRQ